MSGVSGDLETCIALFLFGSTALWAGYRRFRQKQLIEDMPTSRIGFAAQGLIEVQGKARAIQGQTFSSYLKDQAVYLRFVLEQRVHTRRGKEWKKIANSTQGKQMVVEDATGIVFVDLEKADFVLKQESFEFDSDKDPACIEMNFPPFNLKFGRYRITEQKITIGESVLVIGDFRTASLEPEVKVLGEQGEVRNLRPKGSFRKNAAHPYLISDSHQEDLLKKVSWGFQLMILGAALVSIGTYLFFRGSH